MMYQTEVQEIIKFIESSVIEKKSQALSDDQIKIIEGTIQGLKYEEMVARWDLKGIRDKGRKLWELLSGVFGKELNKHNFLPKIKVIIRHPKPPPLPIPPHEPLPNDIYIERSPIESDCDQELWQPGAFVRIKAPRKMGKTCLLEQVMINLQNKGSQTLRYDFGLADRNVFSDYGEFVYQFCAGVTEQLELSNDLEKYWSKNLGFNQNTSNYFEKYLLTTINKPFVLALDSFDCVFEHEKIAVDFCKLLRGWHDKAQEGYLRSTIWQQLRLVVTHSTDIYSNLDINSSPLAGIGKTISLKDFTSQQVEELAQRYQLDLTSAQIEELMRLIGGHPYLITKSFEYLLTNEKEISLPEFLELAATNAPPFGNHLRQILATLKQHPELGQSYAQVIDSSQLVSLPSDNGFKLFSLGLVDFQGNQYSSKCNLYRQYFLAHLDEIDP